MSMMYSLTAMTGKEASATRTVVIGTVEFNWRVWMILLWSSPIGVLVAAMAWPLIGEIAVFMLPIVWGAALFLIQRRSRDGLQLRTYQAMWDKKKASTGQFFLCGVPIDIDTSDYRTVTPNAVAYVAPEKASSETLVDVLARVPLAPGVVSAAERDTPAAALPFADTEDPAEAARARRAAEAASRPQPAEPVAEPVRVAAPAPEPFAAAPESVTAHIEQPDVVPPAPAPAPAPVRPAPPAFPTAPPVPVNQPFPTPPVAPAPDPLFDNNFDPFASMTAPAPVPDHVPGPALPGLDESTIGIEAPDDLPDVASFFETDDPAHRSRFGRKKDDQ